jgi:hypothetical protein
VECEAIRILEGLQTPAWRVGSALVPLPRRVRTVTRQQPHVPAFRRPAPPVTTVHLRVNQAAVTNRELILGERSQADLK